MAKQVQGSCNRCGHCGCNALAGGPAKRKYDMGFQLKSGCPICGEKIERRPGQRKLFVGKPVIEWKCLNSSCDESTHWNLAGEHPRISDYRRR
jgi:hypothetical protein